MSVLNPGVREVSISGRNALEPNRLAYAITEPALITLTTPDGGGQATHPSVIYLPRGFASYKWWMAATPYPDGDNQEENPCVWVSNDGENFIPHPSITNPIEPSPAGAAYNRDVEIVSVPETSELRVYWGNNLGEGYYRSISTAAVVGARVALTGQPFAMNQATVVRADGQYRAWSTTNVSKHASTFGSFPMYTSSDGVTFTTELREARHNLFGSIWHHGITYDAAGFHCIASVNERGDPDRRGMELFYGYSHDGTYWSFDSTPLMARNQSWANDFVYKSHIVPMGADFYRVFVGGRSTAGAYRIGYVDVRLNNPALGHSLAINNLPPRTIELFRDLEIRGSWAYHFYRDTTGTQRWSVPELGLYRHKQLIAINSHDQPVAMRFLTATATPLTFTGSTTDGDLDTAVIAEVAAPQVFTKDTVKWLGVMPPVSATLAAQGQATAPTSGSLTVLLQCWN